MIERALELAQRRAQAAEVSLVRSRSTSADYQDDKLKRVAVAQATHVGVRVIADGKLGSAQATDPEEIEEVVARAAELAQFGSEARFDFAGTADLPKVETYDPEVERIPKEDLVSVGAEMLDLIKAYNDEIKVFGGAGWSIGERRIANSSGLDIKTRSSMLDVGAGGELIRGTDMLAAHATHNWRKRVADPSDIAKRAIEHFRLAERNVPIASKPMAVILSPRACVLLLYCLQMGVNGKNVLKGDSPLAGRLGEKIAPDGFSLIDDGTIDYAPGSAPCDGEGVPRRRTPIVENGRLNAFLYDLETAGSAGAQSTGNGPGCEPSNLVIPPGDVTFDDMVKGTREGLLIEHVMGLGQSNLMNGDLSVNVSLGYKIENGEIAGRVKDVMLAGNVYNALTRIDAIGSEPDWAWTTCAPPIRIETLSVVAKG